MAVEALDQGVVVPAVAYLVAAVALPAQRVAGELVVRVRLLV